MLYDCKAEEVRLEKEIEIMKNYIDLEKERYDNKIEISWSVEGDIKDKFISPLLMLPFLENAFKHGVSEQIEKPWLSIDISVKSDTLTMQDCQQQERICVLQGKWNWHYQREEKAGVYLVRKA